MFEDYERMILDANSKALYLALAETIVVCYASKIETTGELKRKQSECNIEGVASFSCFLHEHEKNKVVATSNFYPEHLLVNNLKIFYGANPSPENREQISSSPKIADIMWSQW